MSVELHQARAEARRRHRDARQSAARQQALVFVALSAILAVFASAHPTGHTVVDALYRAGFGALVALAAGRSRRGPTLVMCALALAFSRGWWIAPAALAIVVAFAGTLQPRRLRRVGAAVGAVAAQVLLHLHAIGFHGLTALITCVAVAPVVVSAYRAARSSTQKVCRRVAISFVAALVVLSIPAVIGALLARADIQTGVANTNLAFNSASNANQATAVAALNRAHIAFQRAHRKSANPFTLVSGLVPVVSQHRTALASTTSTAVDVTAVASKSASEADYNQLRYRAGHLDTTKLAAMTPPLERLTAALRSAEKATANVDDPWLVGPVRSRLRSFTHQIDKALPEARLATEASSVAPALLGADGPRHYLVAFMTPTEQRGLGGFVGAWGEVVADHGHLQLVRSGDAGTLRRAAPDGTRHISGPADYLARYYRFGAQNSPGDAFFSPDFPTDAHVLAELYPQSGGVPVDGVLALDPKAMAALLQITGPIQVEGRTSPLTSKNVEQFLLHDQYVEFPQPGIQQRDRHDYLQDVMRATFDKLTNGTLPGPRSLADLLSPSMHQGRLLFWSRHADEQALMKTIGLDGTFPGARARAEGSDLLALTTQNEGQSKIDNFLQRSITYDVRTDPDSGATTATATVRLHNTAPSTGLPPYLIGNNFGLPEGTNATYATLYSGLELEAVDVDGTDKSFDSNVEAGANAYGLSVQIPPGGTRTITYHLSGVLPPAPDRRLPGGAHRAATRYALILHPQPMVLPDQVEVRLSLPPGWHADPTATLRGVLTTERTWTADVDH
ncbi:MAG TPA: DUF4012 domain-containing protein [Acidimicrobiales bacterium]|nr:DUF4012 domain-containing protein [Acidimicrobiales bacterium]